LVQLARIFCPSFSAAAADAVARPDGGSRRERAAARWPDAPPEAQFPVYLVERDPGARASLAAALRAAGFEVRSFATPGEFIVVAQALEPGCLVTHVAEIAALGLRAANDAGCETLDCPAILLFDTLDADDAVAAIRSGAVDLLRRPVSAQGLAAALRGAEARVREQHARRAALEARRAVERLSPRERDVMAGLMEGHSSKEIARDLGISHRTVEMHRNHLNEKLGVSSFAGLLGVGWRARMLDGA